MASCNIFEEDEICIQSSSGSYKYGLVLMSSDFFSSDEDDDLPGSISKGMVRVVWHPNGEETMIEENKLILTDRSLMPGDVVRRLVEGQDSQRGFVKDMQIKCHLKVLGANKWLYNIDSKDLKGLGDWDSDREVTLDQWVGRITQIDDSITLRFADGARCIIHESDIATLEDVNHKSYEHTEFSFYSFYAGQELIGSSSADFYGAEWLDTTPIHNPDTLKIKMFYDANPVTVEKVETIAVNVHWLCRGFTASGETSDKLEAPPTRIEGDNLKRMKMLDCFEHCSVQIGDKVIYTVKETDELSKVKPGKNLPPDVLQTAACTVIKAKSKSSSKSNIRAKLKVDESLETQSTAYDDFCEDANQSDEADLYEDIDEYDSDDSLSHSGTKSPFVQRKTSRRKRGHFSTKNMKKVKGKKAKKKYKPVDKIIKPGDKVAVDICYTFTTATVVWQDGTEEEGIPSTDLLPIHHLDELEFFPGDFVVDAKVSEINLNRYGAIVCCDHIGRVCTVKWFTPFTPGQCSRPEESEPVEVSVYDIKDHPDFTFRPAITVIRISGFEESADPQEAVGQVQSLGKDGTMQVWWPNGRISTCYPQDLFIVSEEISDLDSSEDSVDEEEEEEGSECSWETEDEEELEDEEGGVGESNREENPSKETSLLELAENKKRELDELLARAQTAISSLLQVFINAPNHRIHNCEPIFKEIISIANSCRELESILNSSFLEDLSFSSFLIEMKEAIRKEKCKRLTKHVHQLYESRNKLITVPSEGDENQTAKHMMSEEVRINESVCTDTDLDQSATKTLAEQEFKHVYNSLSQDIRDDYNSAKHLEFEHLWKDVSEISCKNTIFESLDDSLKLELTSTLVSENLVSPEDHLLTAQGENQCIEFDPFGECSACFSMKEDIEATENGKRERKHADCVNSLGQNWSLLSEKDDISSSREYFVASENSTRNENSDKSDICVENSQKCPTDAKKSNENLHNLLVDGLIKLAQLSKQNSADSDKEEQNNDMADRSFNSLQLCTNICRELNLAMIKIRSEMDKKWKINQAMLRAEVDSPGMNASQTSDSVGKGDLQDSAGKDDSEEKDSAGKCIFQPSAYTSSASYESLLYQAENISPINKTISTSSNLSQDEETMEDVQQEITEKPAYLSHEEDSDLEKHSAQERYNCTSDTEVTSPTATRGFQYLGDVHLGHRFTNNQLNPVNTKLFNIAVRKEVQLLQSSLPEGILVKGYEDRLDLYSALIIGPARTPYEDGLFCFDIQLPCNYPNAPPLFHYLSYCSERLNPNLYDDGKVCISLLGTWTGRGMEMWTSMSNLLQVLVSIQGLILVSEPYYNEAGYEKQRGTQHGQENSQMYNEMAILKLTQSMTKMARLPPVAFVEEVKTHLKSKGQGIIKKFQTYIQLSEKKMLQTSISSTSTSSEAVMFTQQSIIAKDSPSVTDGGVVASCDSRSSSLNPGSTPAEISTTQDEFMTEIKNLSITSKDPHPAPVNSTIAPTGPDSQQQCKETTAMGMPDLGFPLLPASKGFCISMKHHLKLFEETLEKTVFNSGAEAVI
ncbi:hypothetical protein CHS0354_004422 [Potamilus streckersoni]|uniref:UBC core domain-containing protein n=1 Tax=Potamilus streckersoni TaxID=2493646 RepID=A0AAE0TB64_9BIVA|nr:hypothetical protein CHS0354_004422 [Potamilus streckersoni]